MAAAKTKPKKSTSQEPAAPALPAYAVSTWAIDKLKPYDRNARIHGKEQIQQLRSSFRKFGQVWPILVREDGTIIAGHGRLEAAKAERFKAVQVIVATGWSEEQCRAFGLLDNRVPLNAEWDDDKLRDELAELMAASVDLGELGFAPLEYANIGAHAGTQGLTDPDEAPVLPVVPVSTRGDLWAMGAHRLICGDATSAEDTHKVLRGATPHLMVTDPPLWGRVRSRMAPPRGIKWSRCRRRQSFQRRSRRLARGMGALSRRGCLRMAFGTACRRGAAFARGGRV